VQIGGQAISRVVSHLDSFIDVVERGCAQHGAENLALGQVALRRDVTEQGRPDVEAAVEAGDLVCPTGQQLPGRVLDRPRDNDRIRCWARRLMTGPTSVSGSCGSPILASAISSATRSSTAE